MNSNKSLLTYCFAFILSLFLFLPYHAQAQIGKVQDFIQAGREDASILVEEYLSPVSSGVGAGVNSGWFSSGGTRHTLGFSIQLRSAIATIPTSDQTFDITELNLSEAQLDNDGDFTGDPLSPTISGEDENPPVLEVEKSFELPNGDQVTEDLVQFTMPDGLNLTYVPAPMIQANVGLPKNIELSGRIIPETPLQLPLIGDKDYGTFKMFGLGAKHVINGYIPGGNLLPVDISLMGGFNNIELTSDLNLKVQPDANTAEDPEYTGNYENQQVKAQINSYTINILAGKDLPIISVYG